MKADELKPFYYKTFTLEELRNYFQHVPGSMKVQLSRLSKSGKLIRLKKNLYTFPDFHPNAFVIGQQMVSPSYYSLESVLSWSGIIPEGAAAYTLITSKKTQQYTNEFGTFSYRHLSPQLFFGVEQRKDGAWIATPEKALLDYLYLHSRKFRPNFTCWQAERFDQLEVLNFETMKLWASQYGMKKLGILVESLRLYVQSSQYQVYK